MLDGEIINADASQVYRDLSILSARPDVEEEAQAPHHLFGFMDGREACSTALWRDLAKQLIEDVWARNHVPVIVGGTGLYLRTLLTGIAEVPEITPKVRDGVRMLGSEDLRAALEAEDPLMASRLNPADRQRQSRALEVIRSTGRSLNHWQAELSGGMEMQEGIGPILKFVLLPDRATLYARCESRFASMLGSGALEEVGALLARKLDPSLPVMKAVGVPELASHLDGSSTLSDAMAAACQATRRYAKRQYTWMRNQFGDWHQLECFGESLINEDLAILLREYGLTVK